MAIQMNITTEGLAKFRAALETGNLETLKTAKFYGGWSGGAVSGSVVATLDITVNAAVESNSNVCRFICQDKSDKTYTTYGGEVIDADGVIVATFNNGGSPVSTKQSKAEMMLGFEIKFEENTAASSVINMGDTTFVFDDATETAAGIIELATEAEAKAGTDAKRAITPKTLKAKLLEYLPLLGGMMKGSIHFDTGANIYRSKDDSYLLIFGGAGIDRGSRLVLSGKDSSDKGAVYLEANNGDTYTRLIISHEGRFFVYRKDGTTRHIVQSVNGTNADAAGNVVIPLKFLPLAGGTMEGTIKFSKNEEQKVYVDDNGDLLIGGNYGGLLRIRGANSEDNPRGFQIRAGEADGVNVYLIGAPDGTLTWGGSQALLPAGAVFAFAANTTPSGCLICNGAAVSRTTYSRLFAAIGTTYGSGDGTTTFNVPNLTDRFIQGSGTAGTYKAAGLPNITGKAGPYNVYGSRNNQVSVGALTSVKDKDYALGAGGGGPFNFVELDASKSNSIYGESTTVQPPALTMRYYIKY